MEKAALETSAKPSTGAEKVPGTTSLPATQTNELSKPTVPVSEMQKSQEESLSAVAAHANGAVSHDDTVISKEKSTAQKINDTYQNSASVASNSESKTDIKEISVTSKLVETTQSKDTKPSSTDKLGSTQRKPEEEDAYPLISVDSVICVTKSKPCDPQAVVPQSLETKTVKPSEPDLSPQVLASVVTSAVVTEATLTLSGTNGLVLNDTRAVCDSRRVEAQVEQQIQRLASDTSKTEPKDKALSETMELDGAVKATVNGELDVSPETDERVEPSTSEKKQDDPSKKTASEGFSKETTGPVDTKKGYEEIQRTEKTAEAEIGEEPSPLSEEEPLPPSKVPTEETKTETEAASTKGGDPKVSGNHEQNQEQLRTAEKISTRPVNGSTSQAVSEDMEQDIINSAVVMHKNLVNAEHSLDLSLSRIDVKPICVESIPLPESAAVIDTTSDTKTVTDTYFASETTGLEKGSEKKSTAEATKKDKDASESAVLDKTKTEQPAPKEQQSAEVSDEESASPSKTTTDPALSKDGTKKDADKEVKPKLDVDSHKEIASSVPAKSTKDVKKKDVSVKEPSAKKDVTLQEKPGEIDASGDLLAETDNYLLSDELIMVNGIPSSMTESMIDFDTVHEEAEETMHSDHKITPEDKKVISGPKDVPEKSSANVEPDSKAKTTKEVIKPKDKTPLPKELAASRELTTPDRTSEKSDVKGSDADILSKNILESRTGMDDVSVDKSENPKDDAKKTLPCDTQVSEKDDVKRKVDDSDKKSVSQETEIKEKGKSEDTGQTEITQLSDKPTVNGITDTGAEKQREISDKPCRTSFIPPKTCDVAVGHEPRMIRVAAGDGESEEVDGEQASAEVEVTEDSGGPAGEEGEENDDINDATTGGSPNGSGERTESRTSSKISTPKPDSAGSRAPTAEPGRESVSKENGKSGSATSRSSIPDAIQYEPPERKKSATSEVGRTITPESKLNGITEKSKEIHAEPITEEQESKEAPSQEDASKVEDDKKQEKSDDQKIPEEISRVPSAGKEAEPSKISEVVTEPASEKDTAIEKESKIQGEEKEEKSKTDDEKLAKKAEESGIKIEENLTDEKADKDDAAKYGKIENSDTGKEEKTDKAKEDKEKVLSDEQPKSEVGTTSQEMETTEKEDKGELQLGDKEKSVEPEKEASDAKEESPPENESIRKTPEQKEKAEEERSVKDESVDKDHVEQDAAQPVVVIAAEGNDEEGAKTKTPEVPIEKQELAPDSSKTPDISAEDSSKDVPHETTSEAGQETMSTTETAEQVTDEFKKESDVEKVDTTSESGIKSEVAEPKSEEEESKELEKEESKEPIKEENKQPEKEEIEQLEGETKETEQKAESKEEEGKISEDDKQSAGEIKAEEAEEKETEVSEQKEAEETEEKKAEEAKEEDTEETEQKITEGAEVKITEKTEEEKTEEAGDKAQRKLEEKTDEKPEQKTSDEPQVGDAGSEEPGHPDEEEAATKAEETDEAAISKTDDQSTEKEAGKSEEKEEDELEKDATPEASLDSGVSSDKNIEDEEKDKKDQDTESKDESEPPADAEQLKESSDVDKEAEEQDTDKAVAAEDEKPEDEGEGAPADDTLETSEERMEEKPSEEAEGEKQDIGKEETEPKAEEPPKSPVKRMKSPDKGGRRGVSPLSSQPKPIKTPPSPKKPQKSSSPRKKNGMLSPIKTPKTPGADSRKLPPIKAPVGLAPNPNLKNIKSKIGSFDNIRYKPGGGDKKVISMKLDWKATPKIGSLDNTTYKPGAGEGKKHRSKERGHSKDSGDAQAGDGQSPMPPTDSEPEVEGAMAMSESLIKTEGSEMPSAITAES